MTRRLSVLAPVLRSETQARLLAALLLQPEREASIAELARETGADPGNLHAEVERLVQAGILTDRRAGRTRLLRAADSPLNRPLADLLVLGYGPKPAAERALRPIPAIDHAYIGGSWAARYLGENGPFPHDIDIIIVGSPDRDDTADAVIEAMTAIGHDAQLIFRSTSAWREARDAFTRTAKAKPLVELNLETADG
ncbi:MAG: helix-turn-helix domain-containing protein [Actinomycetota bacterium]|nr:helix-turn-helix domain-containing protein [Actinomycetota bacterium]MDQ2956751.1 helix-turn-helix domain-containing protein [Actinomycetota bacterium]